MDNPLGHDMAHHLEDLDYAAEDSAIEPPPEISTDERRMHVRAYNHWASLLQDRRFPSIEDLEPASIEDFAPYSVLLDFTASLENPAVPYLGSALRQECDIHGEIEHIADVPSRSLLSRLTDHYLQIIANGAPIGFEAEFLNQRGTEILYRGILMPFSSDDDTIDFIYGVINWKEMADRNLTDELILEVGQALRSAPSAAINTPIWADGPSAVFPEPLLPAEQDGTLVLAEPDADAPLADWLALARDFAGEAQAVEDRSHSALYRAIGLAYDFALLARNNAQEYAELLQDAGIKVQARAPMTPIVKLIFGANYDKTRLAEYATALDHGMAGQIEKSTLAAYLEAYPGGLKALVRNERLARKQQRTSQSNPVHEARRKLCSALAIPFEEIATDEEGLAVMVGRREADGSLSIVAAIDGNSVLAERVVRKAAA
ncbi:PAS domain-containing protein [Rhizorhapis suberifaciens]|uniref:PAS domain-containing protein n=1 Tax=Rhizorhapis suberifaciens TaxID=13656 RepID=A0A840HT18_9SPHN|nr:hypothetical protein [Rhizorhapis suberifaciens]MBB4640757.1 hypothetical protein [Rhizorhapis suberifaciens]